MDNMDTLVREISKLPKISLSSEIGQMIASAGGKCNKPPSLATAEAKRLWRNKRARVRGIEHKLAKEVGITRKKLKEVRTYAFVNSSFNNDMEQTDEHIQ